LLSFPRLRWAVQARITRPGRVVVVDGMVHDNPYYIEPSEFLGGTGLGNGGQPTWW
jgi:hypothetical protein